VAKQTADAQKAKFKSEVQAHFTAQAATEEKPTGAVPPKGTCTINAAGMKVTKKNVTEELCARVAKAVGGTYTFKST
jgi:hypothetical protein